MSRRILLLGSSGMLGQDIAQVFHEDEIIALGSKDCDLTRQDTIESCLAAYTFDVLINCSGYTAVDKAEEEEARATVINGDAVGILASLCKKRGVPLVHFSTDYVFNGKNEEGYEEDDARDPLSAYGRSKAKGEEEIEQSAPDFYIIRTAWLYGYGGHNFVETMRRLSAEREELGVVADQWGSPTWTKDLAVFTKELLDEHYPFGIYHGVNAGKTTWADFTREICSILERTTTVKNITTEDYPTPAKRPHYSVLHNTKGPVMRPWQDALADYLASSS